MYSPWYSKRYAKVAHGEFNEEVRSLDIVGSIGSLSKLFVGSVGGWRSQGTRIGGTLYLPTNTKVDSLDNSMRKTFIILFYIFGTKIRGRGGLSLPLIYNQLSNNGPERTVDGQSLVYFGVTQ